MPDKEETIVIIVIVILVMVFVIPKFFTCPYGYLGCGQDCPCKTNAKKENFTSHQKMVHVNDNNTYRSQDPISPRDPTDDGESNLRPRGTTADYESLIYDNATGTIMTGSQFMENTGIIAPLWIPPAWDPDAYGPSSTGELDPADYENDPRMLYNKCSLSCCSPQYPTPFKGDVDPFVCDKNGDSKYLASDYLCTNNTGGTGCLCMSQKQVDGMQNSFVNYKTKN